MVRSKCVSRPVGRDRSSGTTTSATSFRTSGPTLHPTGDDWGSGKSEEMVLGTQSPITHRSYF